MSEDYEDLGLLKKIGQRELGAFLSGRYGVATHYFSAEELNHIQKDAYSRVIKDRIKRFMNPLRIMGKIHSIEDLRYCFRLLNKGIKQLKQKYERKI
jgi:predicted ATP-dependent Lon-type protease